MMVLRGASSSTAASENYAEQKLDTMAIAGGHAEQPFFLARDVPVPENLVRETMPGLVEQYQPLREQMVECKRRGERLPRGFNYFGYSLGHAIVEALIPSFLQDAAYLMHKHPSLKELRPFNQMPFNTRAFQESQERVVTAVLSMPPPPPLRILFEDVWAKFANGGRQPLGNLRDSHPDGFDDVPSARARTCFSAQRLVEGDGRQQAAEVIQQTSNNWRQNDGQDNEYNQENGVKAEILRLAHEADAMKPRTKSQREKLIQVWKLAGEQLSGSQPGADRFVDFTAEYFQGTHTVPPIRDLVYGNRGKLEALERAGGRGKVHLRGHAGNSTRILACLPDRGAISAHRT